jgi:lysophospholipase L1-like esterase
LVVFFGGAELVLRWRKFDYPPVEPIQVWNRVEDRDMRLGTSIHEYTARQLWRPRAGAEVPWGGTVNEDGYRGPVRSLEKPPGVFRVVTLGDSSTFGHSVQYEETYSAQLEKLLRLAGFECEVIDCGVVGFSIRQGIERYDELARRYHPDVVVEAFGAVNDHLQAIGSLPDKEKIEQNVTTGDYWTELAMSIRQKWRVVQFIAKRVDLAKGITSDVRDREFKKELVASKLEKSVGNVDWPGKRRVPLADFEACLFELQKRVEADGARLVLLSMPRKPNVEKREPVLAEYSKTVEEVGARQGLDVVDGRALFQAALQQGRKPEELFADDYHPKPPGHRMLAEELAKAIVARFPPPAK